MQFESEAPEPRVLAGRDRRSPRATIIACLLVIGFFTATYAYNAVAFARNSVRGDQWVWVESVLIPYHNGDMSLFDAVKWEFDPLSHSHIPSLIVFLLSYELLDLDLTPDRVIGFIALAALLLIVFRHARGFLRLDAALVVTAVSSSILFMSSDANNFGWSLLQFQMIYVLIAIVYLRSFATRYETHPVIHALIAMPLTLLLGDAIGVAAVLASLVYLAMMAVLRKVPMRPVIAYVGLFPLQVLALSAVFRGERPHTVGTMGDFLDRVLDDPVAALKGMYYGLAAGFVSLRSSEFASPLLEWRHAPLWFAMTVAVGGLALLLVRRTPLEVHDRFPILVILASLIWTVGVIRSRFLLLGPATMQAPRYAPYTTLVGIGLILLLASKVRFQPRLRRPLLLTAAVVVLANALGSLKILDNQLFVDRQKGEMTDLRAYVLDQTQLFDVTGGRCSNAPCLRAGWFLYDMRLAPFRGDESPRSEWESDLRDLTFAVWDDMAATDRLELCFALPETDDAMLIAWTLNEPPFELAEEIERSGTEIPTSSRALADRLVVRALRSVCGQPTDAHP